jgi:ubiquinone/menaquinone biosynthesis C-methylase UbiE
MLRIPDKAVLIQRRYYADTASQYDVMHAHEAGDDPKTFRLVCALIGMIEPRTVLDVGAGTGRNIRHLLDCIPSLSVRGIEPVAALIEQAVQKNGVSESAIVQGVGEALPLADASFDVVCSFGTLHHVPDPGAVVCEMLRVARKAVIIVDGNRFGQGRRPLRLLKLVLYKLRLWKIVNYIKTMGKGYSLTEGDGLAYSYSLYDSLDCIAKWADHLMVVLAGACKATTWFHPLLTASGVMVCAVKEVD